MSTRQKVTFMSEGKKLVGNLFIPENLKQDEKLPAIVVATPGGGIKEQTAGTYAKKLSDKGFITLVYDSRTYGESEGQPRATEEPHMKIGDIYSAISYLGTLKEVDNTKIFGLGVCAGGGYMSTAVATDRRMKAIATVSAYFDQREMMLSVMGKDALVGLTTFAGQARQKYYETGEMMTMPIFEEDESKRVSQLQKESCEYYLTKRGNHPNFCQNKFSMATSVFSFSGYDYAELISPTPLLAIVGSRAESAPQTHHMLELINNNETTELFTIKGASHIDLYDKDEYVDQAVKKINSFFRDKINE
jgi:fermentation-respiration switch protein FrsA (DUF1100 family)